MTRRNESPFPLKLRPGDLPQADPSQPDTPVEWEDNAVSNLFAWASYTILPNWCQTPEHWTSRLTQYLFTDCPCCLLFRGITVGILFGIPVGMVLIIFIALIFR